MSRWLFGRRKRDDYVSRTASEDAEVMRLTAKADLIMDELGGVVGQMADMLREAHGTDKE